MNPQFDPPIRVVSVPSGHPYVENLTTKGLSLPARVVRLADPQPDGAAPGQWWPPVALDAEWIRAEADSFDVFHLHFGTESFSREHLGEVVDALRAVDKPLVYTVHDLENPQLTDQSAHLGHLDLILSAADEIITLTSGAAAAVSERFGREATVVAHPNILPLEGSAPIGTGPDDGAPTDFVVGMHLRDLRPNIDAVRATRTLLEATALVRARGVDVVARVDVNERVRDEDARADVAALVATSPHATLVTHPRLSDTDLAASLADLDVAVLPYRHGTHSGWAELCFDLGVPVAGPRVGFVAEQHPRDFHAFDAGDARTLADAIENATRGCARPGSPERRALVESRRAFRLVQRHDIERAHLAIYERALAGVGVTA